MRSSPFLRRLEVACVAAVTVALVSTSVFASAPSKEDKKRAAAAFHEGEALFKKHSYAEAAEAFERANALAPHTVALMNGVDAHIRAGQIARAANLCAQLIREAPPDNPQVPEARRQLADLKDKVALLRISGDAASIKIDAKSLALPEVYVDAGDHTVEGTVDGELVTRKIQATAGSTVRIVLDRPATPATEEKKPTAPPPTSASSEAPSETHQGLSSTWVWVGAGATAVLGGVTLWSGLDTNAARRDFDARPTQSGLDDGRSKQTRTNVLVGVTAALGVTTLGLAIFATDWGSKSSSGVTQTSLSVGPSGVFWGGSFR